MKRISTSSIIISILVAIVILMAVALFKMISWDIQGERLMFADNTPTADIPAPANETVALRLISPENHMPNICLRFDRAPEKRIFYQKQLKAIDYIREHLIKAAIPDLILYLDYPTSGLEAALKDYAHGPEMDRSEKVWPAFGALMEIPGSDKVLRDYCLDASRPMRYRRAAFVILKYLNPSLLESCWQTLKSAELDKKSRDQFEAIKNDPHAFFWGMQEIEDK